MGPRAISAPVLDVTQPVIEPWDIWRLGVYTATGKREPQNRENQEQGMRVGVNHPYTIQLAVSFIRESPKAVHSQHPDSVIYRAPARRCPPTGRLPSRELVQSPPRACPVTKWQERTPKGLELKWCQCVWKSTEERAVFPWPLDIWENRVTPVRLSMGAVRFF